MDSNKMFAISQPGKGDIWRTDSMNNILVWVLKNHGLSYKWQAEQMGVSYDAARKMGKDGKAQTAMMQSKQT